MKNFASAMFHPDAEIALEYSKEMVERAKELARSQLDAAEHAYSEVFKEYRELLTLAEPSDIFHSLPKMLESIMRNTTEGSVSVLKNSINFQNELIQMIQHKVPELNKQIIATVLEPIAAVGATAFATAERMHTRNNGNGGQSVQARSDNGGKSQPSRASKAA